jgi:glutamyl-tRNA reductase
MAERALGDLADRRAAIVGTGETATLVARALSGRGTRMVFIANRHFDKAADLARRFGGEAARPDELGGRLDEADLVVCATNSPHHVIEAEDLGRRGGGRSERQLMIIDLAVPRDVAPECRDLQGLILRDVDDVQRMVEQNTGGRHAEARQAELIIDAELTRFETWLASLEVLPTVASLRDFASGVVDRVLAENSSRWQDLNGEDRARVEAMAHTIASRMLHAPTMRLREVAGSDRAYESVNMLRELFSLDVETVAEAAEDATVTPILRRSDG